MTARPPIGLLVNIDVDDLERGVRFYTEALGLRVGRRFSESAVELLGAGVPIYLLEKAEGSSATASTALQRGYVRHWTPVHLDIVVDSLELAVDVALHAGAVLESAIAQESFGRIAMFADPFGHGFCLLEFNQVGYDAPGL
ncbi:MAG: glyoxalase [Myxococcaceae bacterium]|nr:glyoxalase [Myxococcaceae bacterium]